MQLLFSTLLLVLLSFPVHALDLHGKCQIQFLGSTTIDEFEGVGACHPFTLALIDEGDDEFRVDGIELRIPIEMMETGSTARNRQMYEMFDSQDYPEIIGRLPAEALDDLRRKLHGAAYMGWSFPLEIEIHGSRQKVIARVTQLIDSELAFAVDFKFHIALTDFEIEPPTAMWVVEVDNHVLVSIKVQLEALPTPATDEP
jgi:hypothetical protein